MTAINFITGTNIVGFRLHFYWFSSMAILIIIMLKHEQLKNPLWPLLRNLLYEIGFACCYFYA